MEIVLELLTNFETYIAGITAALGVVLAASKKLRRKLKAGAKAVKDTE
jgi:type II secretory pathway predicted ATPase ExeA